MQKPSESSLKPKGLSGTVRGTGNQRQSNSDRKPVISSAFKKQGKFFYLVLSLVLLHYNYSLNIIIISDPPNENESNVSFIQWLASVTERINQTMHFQFSGDPEPLVFHVPQVGLVHLKFVFESRIAHLFLIQNVVLLILLLSTYYFYYNNFFSGIF